MSTIDTWDPSQPEETPKSIDPKVLQRFIALSAAGELNNISSSLTATEISEQAYLMTLHKDVWLEQAADLSVENLTHLIHFFTLAEQQVSGWEAGSKSPVVWLCRILKAKAAFPDKTLIQWIKSHTDNRFLPYGNVLDF